MADFTLVIGNRNTSSWSLRAWLMLTQAGPPFDEVNVWFGRPGVKEAIAVHSPSGMVPVLKHGERVIWETLAIAEYLNELFPDAGLWPADAGARAHARTVSAEMHAGFYRLRRHMPMDVANTRLDDGQDARAEPGVDDDIARIAAIWEDTLERFGGGGFLFGPFTAADAMYAPVVSRFRTYGVALGPAAQAYADAVWEAPAMRAWAEGARAEPPLP